MGKKLLAAASFAIGLALFIVVLMFAGFDNIVKPFTNFSPFYLAMFLLMTFLLYATMTLRWHTVLRYQGIRIPFFQLLRLRLIGVAVSYLTPAARVGGEPVRGYLLKKRLGIEGRHSYSSILIETAIGMSIDAIMVSATLFTLLLLSKAPQQIIGLAWAIAILSILAVLIFYSTLLSRLGPFSMIFRFLNKLIRANFLKRLVKKITIIEEMMIEFFKLKKKGMFETILIAAASWPLSILQYKFALLSIGFDASVTIIALSIIATTIAAVVPVPGAFGVQEAGHFSLFSIIAVSSVGIALSLLIRFKDLLATFVGLIFLSHEGLSIFEVLKKNKNNSA